MFKMVGEKNRKTFWKMHLLFTKFHVGDELGGAR
jgi:hypothetical protein